MRGFFVLLTYLLSNEYWFSIKTTSLMARYNIYFRTRTASKTITLLSKADLDKVLNPFADGKQSFFLKGEKYFFAELRKLNVFETEISNADFKAKNYKLKYQRSLKVDGHMYPIWSPKDFRSIGKDITKEAIGNKV
ncbi:MAG: hypothetical protein AAF502_17975 [Bacteroidota bacterium]